MKKTIKTLFFVLLLGGFAQTALAQTTLSEEQKRKAQALVEKEILMAQEAKIKADAELEKTVLDFRDSVKKKAKERQELKDALKTSEANLQKALQEIERLKQENAQLKAGKKK